MTLESTAVQQEISEGKNRVTLTKFFLIIFPMWISAKFYGGPYNEFIRNYFAAILLIIFLSLIFQLIFPKAPEKKILFSVFIGLTLIQVINYFVPSIFAGLSFTIGQGNFFGGQYSLHMIPYYGVGGFIGFYVLKQGRSEEEES